MKQSLISTGPTETSSSICELPLHFIHRVSYLLIYRASHIELQDPIQFLLEIMCNDQYSFISLTLALLLIDLFHRSTALDNLGNLNLVFPVETRKIHQPYDMGREAHDNAPNIPSLQLLRPLKQP
jgi:hypothetical protein